MTKHGIIDDFEAYSEWRKQVRNVIKKYRDVAKAEDLTNANSEQRLNQIISTLNDDKLYIAFVAEFSRGKSELINAIFFATLGKRVLPSSAGRTTMCPSELMYNDEFEPSIRLLPIDTRSTGTSIQEYKSMPEEWNDYPLDIESIIAAREQYQSPHLHTDFIKMFLDGVPTASRTALMLQDYIVDEEHPQQTRGTLLIAPETLTRDLIALDKLGFTVKIHAAGDGSVRVALDAIQAVREANGKSGLRHQLAHAGFIDPQDLSRFAELDVTVDLSPYIWYPSPIIDSIVGAVGERGLDYFPVRGLLDSGANVLMGSDWPSAARNLSPWHAIEALVTRRNPFKDTEDTLWAEQAISLEEALQIATMGGATAMRLEQITGSIEVGKSADFIVLDRNLFEVPVTAISDTQVEQTWFEGRVVYTKGN